MPLFKRRGVTLSELVRGVVKALTDGQQAIPHAREEHLNQHMEEITEDGKTIYKPKTITVEVDQNRRVTVPTYNLAQTNTIGIDSARIKCSARIVDIENAQKCGTMACGDRYAVFKVFPGLQGKNSFEMEINFQQKEPSEAESRLIEALDSVVVESVDQV